MTSTDTTIETRTDEGQDDTARLDWQRLQARRNLESLGHSLKRLEAFATGTDRHGDTYERAAGDVAETAMWMLVEAEEDFPVLTHTHEAWLRLADRIRTRTDALRGTAYQAPTPRIEVAPDGTEIEIGWSLKEAYEAMRHERNEACAELETLRAEHDKAVAGYRAQIDRMLETIDGLADDVKDRIMERDLAKKARDEAIAKADAEYDEVHADCAWVDDLEAQKESTTKAATERDTARGERDSSRTEARHLRLQRNLILAAAAVVIVVLTLMTVPTWG